MSGKGNLSIALVSSYPFTQEPGGVKEFILGLREALKRQNCSVSIIAPAANGSKQKNSVDFILGTGFKIATDQTEFQASLSRKDTAKKILKLIKPDIILINEPFLPSIGHTLISTIIKNKDIRRPIIIGQFHANREDLDWRFKTVEFVVRYLIRRPKLDKKRVISLSSGYVSTINKNLDGRIAISYATEKLWQSKLPSDYKVIYNGIDTDKLLPKGPRINNWNDEKKTILFAGRHDPRKGIDDLIVAFNLLVKEGNKNIKLKITGVGEKTKNLRKIVQGLDLENLIEFVGTLPYSQLVEAYRTADLVVAPSSGGEGFNRTIAEARSCGTLVVCTDIEGHREAIGKDLFPFMAKPNNPRDLADQILKVLSLPDIQKQKIRKRGREEVIRNFDWDIIVKQHLEYYRSLLR
jgi:glycosyltransferase involved in cell wall biosynthesis